MREADGEKITVNGKDLPFQTVGVHAWIDNVSDGICLEVSLEQGALPRCLFINRQILIDKYPGKIGVVNPIHGVLESTARAIWINAAREFIPASASIFWRRVPLEETYGYQVCIWGAGARSYPLKTDVQKQAFDPSALHIRIFSSFLAL